MVKQLLADGVHFAVSGPNVAGWVEPYETHRMAQWVRFRGPFSLNLSRELLLLDFRDCLLAAGFSDGEFDPVTGVHRVQQTL
jgi:hypothetical protein